jgi:ribosome-binding protein aMBF1 (putative translation factor)
MPGRKVKGPSVRRTVGDAPDAAEIPAQRSIDHYVGACLMRLREARAMDLSDVSAQIGTSEDTIAGYESGEQRPSSTDIIALAELYGVRLRELFPESDSQITGRLH